MTKDTIIKLREELKEDEDVVTRDDIIKNKRNVKGFLKSKKINKKRREKILSDLVSYE